MSIEDHNEIKPFLPAKPAERAPQSSMFVYQEHNYTWEQVLRVLRKHARFTLFIAGLLACFVVLYAVFQKDFYRPVARLEIAPPGGGINALHEIDSTLPVEDMDYLETQVQILNSDALAVSVIRELHLDRNPEFAARKLLRQPVENPKMSDPPQKTAGQLSILQDQINLATLTPAEFAALEQFRKRLSVSSIRNTRLVEISFSANTSDEAQLVVNMLISKFIDQNYRHRYTTTMQASEWLSSQLEDLRKKVDDSAQAVADYQKKYGLVEVDDRDVPTSQLMSEVNHQLSEAQANRIENEAYVRMIEEGHGESVPALRDDKLYQDLIGRYVDLRTQLAQIKAVYGEANINVKKLQDQLAELSVQIDAERKRALARARAIYTASRNREELMANQRERLRATMERQSSQLTAFHMLKEEANANATLYNTLQGRLREAGIYAGLRSSNIRVVDMASNLPHATGPHRAVIIVFGAFASFLFAVVLSFVRESFRNTMLTPDDVRSWTGLPSLALLPALEGSTHPSDWELGDTWKISELWQYPKKAEQRAVEIMKSPTAGSEAIRDLRTALLNARQSCLPQVILISSSIEGEGKTTVAVNFAVALAQLGRTCLIDGDLRNPSVGAVFDIAPKTALSDVLESKVPLNAALVDVPAIPNLSILPCGVVPGSPADVLSSSEMKILIDRLKREFQFVVIDSPPVIRFSDARFLSSIADEVVLVGRYGVTTRRAIQRTTEILGEMRASVAGVVLNGIDLSSPDYEYYTYGYASSKNKRGPQYPTTPPGPPNGGEERPGAMRAHA